jgi:hypothetical protein
MGNTNLRPTAAARAPTAATASANTPPAGCGITGSGSTATSQIVKTARTASARSAKQRSQPRTVSAGRATPAAIRRNPTLRVAFAVNADTITDASSARRKNAVTGNNTCVTPHPVQRDRRGHTSTDPPAPRSCRGLARPQPANPPPHNGQLSSPAASLRSTASTSASTVTTAPPRANRRPSRQRNIGRAVAYTIVITVPPRHHNQQPDHNRPHPMLTPSAARPPLRAHPECLRTIAAVSDAVKLLASTSKYSDCPWIPAD